MVEIQFFATLQRNTLRALGLGLCLLVLSAPARAFSIAPQVALHQNSSHWNIPSTHDEGNSLSRNSFGVGLAFESNLIGPLSLTWGGSYQQRNMPVLVRRSDVADGNSGEPVPSEVVSKNIPSLLFPVGLRFWAFPFFSLQLGVYGDFALQKPFERESIDSGVFGGLGFHAKLMPSLFYDLEWKSWFGSRDLSPELGRIEHGKGFSVLTGIRYEFGG